MSQTYKVVDLFAGPGGLAEGFSAFKNAAGRPFEIALSVEKEASAFATLRLRSFFRQFRGKAPAAYYAYLAGGISKEKLVAAFPEEWSAACHETLQAELGTAAAAEAVYPRIDAIARESGGYSVLVGGPPCQAYSLVGRARNRGNAGYVAEEDHRHFLYREYISILRRLKPAVFVMENVKGFLSANVEGREIFGRVLNDLETADGQGSYTIVPLGSPEAVGNGGFILRSEDYGVPQRRHRVILLGIRRDVAHRIGETFRTELALEPSDERTTVADVLGGMSRLRSGLSRKDTAEQWRREVLCAFEAAASAAFEEEDEGLDIVARRLADYRSQLQSRETLDPRSSTDLTLVRHQALGAWLHDPSLETLPNHEARGHMAADLARYAFVATFAEVTGRSPKAGDFPKRLAPAHRNWETGKFADRFRAQLWGEPSTTITSHIAKDGHYFIHPDPAQCRSLTVREAARLQTFPDNYFFEGNRTQQYVQVGNAVPPLLARQIAAKVHMVLARSESSARRSILAA